MVLNRRQRKQCFGKFPEPAQYSIWLKNNPAAERPVEARAIEDSFTKVVKIPEASWTAAERSATPIVEEGDIWLHLKRDKEYRVTCLAYRDIPEGGSETHVVHESGGFHLTRSLSEFQNGKFYLKSSNLVRSSVRTRP